MSRRPDEVSPEEREARIAELRARRKARLDSVSAAVLLESYLGWRRHHPEEEPV